MLVFQENADIEAITAPEMCSDFYNDMFLTKHVVIYDVYLDILHVVSIYVIRQAL